MANEIDELMSRFESWTEKELERVVDYLRGSYANHGKSAKFKRTGAESDKPKIDLSALGLKKATPPLVRRKI